ncbi:MAG: hypothetical protein WBA83_10860 [Burkholderiaceae bacterium]
MPTHDAHAQHSSQAPLPRKGLWSRVATVALLAVMALAFAGYLSPGMRVQWANFMALCGF